MRTEVILNTCSSVKKYGGREESNQYVYVHRLYSYAGGYV